MTEYRTTATFPVESVERDTTSGRHDRGDAARIPEWVEKDFQRFMREQRRADARRSMQTRVDDLGKQFQELVQQTTRMVERIEAAQQRKRQAIYDRAWELLMDGFGFVDPLERHALGMARQSLDDQWQACLAQADFETNAT